MRFLLPVLPLLNIAAAAGLMRAYQNRRKGPGWAGVWLAAVALLVCSAAAVVLMTMGSCVNYPGGHALARLHAGEVASAAEAARTGTAMLAIIKECNHGTAHSSGAVILVQRPIRFLISCSFRHGHSFISHATWRACLQVETSQCTLMCWLR